MTTNKRDQKELEQQYQNWKDGTLKKALDRFPERKEEFTTVSNIPVDPVYTPLNEDTDYSEDLGFPGEYPFTRGVQPTMYRGRFWTMRQYAGFASARETNKRFRYLLDQGQTGLSVAFDLPTQIGYDSDHAMAQGEVGKVGVAVDSLEDMEILLDQIPLDKVSTSMTINAPAAVLLAMYIAIGEKQGIPKEKLAGTIQNDILKEYVARGTYIFPPEPSMRLITDIIKYCSKEVPRWNTISISGYHIREAGSNAIQEIAFTIANGLAYVDAALESGLDIDEFAPRLSFFFNSHLDFFEEIAKFRAARRLWAKLMKERYGAQNPKSMKMRFHTQTAGCTLTAQQPNNNIVRVTLQALAAVLGGTQSLHTNSRDEALSLPTEESVQIALRTQQIIANESGVADTVDPIGGSYYVESLTNQLEEEAQKLIDKIDDLGGAPKAIEQGFIQKEIQYSAYEWQKSVEEEEQIIVGLNKYQVEEEFDLTTHKVDQSVADDQRKRLKDLRDKRDNDTVENKLSELKKAANGDDNLMPYIIDAVKEYATLGEICGALREVFGEYEADSYI
ncbi:acyl-CoA mutase large subunit family protein [Natranaerobius thermophilus]|uniref:methylmalonyl-CoA mutase n=1 Tax=Natranaerobius thermophilus (strain ATCC BAA-1301 / DSM 18059 / JW/NM-WN-LF) TaxID=457570 RepID=B2A3W7_NATTJ|nr:methylmalonyl-CoA mutase family protein [Natranaerobius thermophilus]ACB85069.1 methylmalonyl-CoA mutase [Natranaerobius thermophilus JW/NM-WN-LF]